MWCLSHYKNKWKFVERGENMILSLNVMMQSKKTYQWEQSALIKKQPAIQVSLQGKAQMVPMSANSQLLNRSLSYCF